MNLYQSIWDGGYGKRWAKVMEMNAPINRKQAALLRIWTRMASKAKLEKQ